MLLCEKYSFDWIFSYCQAIFYNTYAYLIKLDFEASYFPFAPDPPVPENDVLEFTYRIASRFPQEAKILPKLFYIMARSSNDLGKLAKSEGSPNGLGLEDVLRVHRILQTGLSLQRDMAENFKPNDLVYHLLTSGCRGSVAPSCRAAATKHWETEWKPLFGSSQLRCRGLLLAPRTERWIASGVREPCVKMMMEEWKKRLKEFDATL